MAWQFTYCNSELSGQTQLPPLLRLHIKRFPAHILCSRDFATMKSSRREDCQDQQHHTFPGTGDKVLAHTSSTKLINLERSGKQKPICYFYLLLRASPLRCPQTLPTLQRYQVAGLNHHKHYTLKHWDNSTPLCQSRSSPT